MTALVRLPPLFFIRVRGSPGLTFSTAPYHGYGRNVTMQSRPSLPGSLPWDRWVVGGTGPAVLQVLGRIKTPLLVVMVIEVV